MDRQQRVYVLTGATSGLGLHAARRLAGLPGSRIVAGLRDPGRAGALAAAVPAAQLQLLPLDTASLASVRAFAAAVDGARDGRPIDGLALNAGMQLAGGDPLSEDGHELTFATNHLGHFLLADLLRPALSAGAALVSTASGTHDPDEPLARRFGFRGALFPDAAAVAAGRMDPAAGERQRALDRYATSKLCNILFTYGMARRIPAAELRFLAFDPGLMPGTGLARARGPVERFAWSHVLPLLGGIVAGVSTAERSGSALARLLSEPGLAPESGLHFSHLLARTATSALSRRQDLQDDLIATSRQLCGLDAVATGGA